MRCAMSSADVSNGIAATGQGGAVTRAPKVEIAKYAICLCALDAMPVADSLQCFQVDCQSHCHAAMDDEMEVASACSARDICC